jgi:pimeloyl-ACP methyl ester carboxylesterase
MRPEDGPHTMSDQLQRARAVIDAQDGPVILMGHSFGGKAALKLAQQYPREKVPAVVTLAPSVNMLHAYWKKVTGERQLPAPEIVQARLARVEASIQHRLSSLPKDASEEEVASLQGHLEQVRFMIDLAKNDEHGTETSVTRPTLVFHGTEDESVSIHYARRFAEANPRSVQMVELPAVGHEFDASRRVRQQMGEELTKFIDRTTRSR